MLQTIASRRPMLWTLVIQDCECTLARGMGGLGHAWLGSLTTLKDLTLARNKDGAVLEPALAHLTMLTRLVFKQSRGSTTTRRHSLPVCLQEL
jgi:hypothetical protein